MGRKYIRGSASSDLGCARSVSKISCASDQYIISPHRLLASCVPAAVNYDDAMTDVSFNEIGKEAEAGGMTSMRKTEAVGAKEQRAKKACNAWYVKHLLCFNALS